MSIFFFSSSVNIFLVKSQPNLSTVSPTYPINSNGRPAHPPCCRCLLNLWYHCSTDTIWDPMLLSLPGVVLCVISFFFFFFASVLIWGAPGTAMLDERGQLLRPSFHFLSLILPHHLLQHSWSVALQTTVAVQGQPWRPLFCKKEALQLLFSAPLLLSLEYRQRQRWPL